MELNIHVPFKDEQSFILNTVTGYISFLLFVTHCKKELLCPRIRAEQTKSLSINTDIKNTI